MSDFSRAAVAEIRKLVDRIVKITDRRERSMNDIACDLISANDLARVIDAKLSARILDGLHNGGYLMRPGGVGYADITDTDRLDLLDRMNLALNTFHGTEYRWELIVNHNVNRLMLDGFAVDLNDASANGFKSCRSAIDQWVILSRGYASNRARARTRAMSDDFAPSATDGST
jgi:hypothetical protein